MSTDPTSSPTGPAYTPSALPSTAARAVAFGAILLSGLCGGLIGYALIELQYEDNPALAGLAALVGALTFAAGVAVVATLALRAMAEWQITQQRAGQPDGSGAPPGTNGGSGGGSDPAS